MELDLLRSNDDTLWRVLASGKQHLPAGRAYWHDNRGRAPLGMCIVQAVTQGEIALTTDRRSLTVPAGSIFLFTYGDASAYGVSDTLPQPYSTEWINLTGPGLAEHFALLRQRGQSVLDYTHHPPLLDELRDLAAMADPRRGVSPTTMAHAVHHYVMRLIEHAAHRRQAGLSPVRLAIDQVLAQPHAVESPKALAAEHGVSREHLARSFRRHTGQPIAEYIRQARLNRALQLLALTDVPIADAATQAGFQSHHALVRAVRQHTGLTPGQWREQQR